MGKPVLRLDCSGQSHALVTDQSAGRRLRSLTLRFSRRAALHQASTVLHYFPVPNIFHIPQKTKAALRRAASPKFHDNLCCALSSYYFVQPASYLPLAQVLPLGPWATPLPFLVLALPPLAV